MSEKDNKFEIETIMERAAEQRVLTSEVLYTESRSKERENSIERLKDAEAHRDTEESKAQEAIFEYILHLGGIREDVYDLLLTQQWKNISTAATLRPFLYYAASPEWIKLAAEVQEKTESFFMNELVAAYKDGIPIEAVRRFIKGSGTLFEMCQCRMQYIRYMEEKTERNFDRVAAPGAAEVSILKDLIADLRKLISGNCSQRELSDSVTRSEKEELSDSVTRSPKKELDDIVTRSEKEELSDSVTRSEKEELDDSVTRSEKEELSDSVTRSEKEELNDIVTQSPKEELDDSVTRSEKEELSDSVTRSEKEELNDIVTQSPKKELDDSVTRSEKAELSDIMAQSQEEEPANFVPQSLENPPEFPKGEEVMDSRMSIADLEEKEKAAGKRISFFAELFKMHQKKSFTRLDENAQVGKLFEIMIGKKYGKKKILAIKKLMDGGMSREFIFSLIENDLPEGELIELCDTLLPEDENGLEPTTAEIDDTKQETSNFEQEMADDSQEEFQDEYEIMDM